MTRKASTLPWSIPWRPSNTSTMGRSTATARSTPRSACAACPLVMVTGSGLTPARSSADWRAESTSGSGSRAAASFVSRSAGCTPTAAQSSSMRAPKPSGRPVALCASAFCLRASETSVVARLVCPQPDGPVTSSGATTPCWRLARRRSKVSTSARRPTGSGPVRALRFGAPHETSPGTSVTTSPHRRAAGFESRWSSHTVLARPLASWRRAFSSTGGPRGNVPGPINARTVAATASRALSSATISRASSSARVARPEGRPPRPMKPKVTPSSSVAATKPPQRATASCTRAAYAWPCALVGGGPSTSTRAKTPSPVGCVGAAPAVGLGMTLDRGGPGKGLEPTDTKKSLASPACAGVAAAGAAAGAGAGCHSVAGGQGADAAGTSSASGTAASPGAWIAWRSASRNSMTFWKRCSRSFASALSTAAHSSGNAASSGRSFTGSTGAEVR